MACPRPHSCEWQRPDSNPGLSVCALGMRGAQGHSLTWDFGYQGGNRQSQKEGARATASPPGGPDKGRSVRTPLRAPGALGWMPRCGQGDVWREDLPW